MKTHILLAFAGCALLTSTAVAQPVSDADALFKEGTQAMVDGRFAAACDAFDHSQTLEPNIATLMNLADCREKNGQLATARSLFVRAEKQAANDPAMANAATLASRRAAALDARLSVLVIDTSHAAIAGLTISRNGIALPPPEWQRPSPLDGGMYAIEVKAPDHVTWGTRIKLKNEKDRIIVEVPALARIAPEPAVETSEEKEDEEPVPPTWTTRRTVALAVGGVSLAALGGAIGFELASRSASEDALVEPNLARQVGLRDAARNRRIVGGTLAGVGIAAAATATYLWVTGRPSGSMVVVPTSDEDSAGISLVGSF